MDSNHKYYVYMLLRPNGEPFYVGKGRDERIGDHRQEAKSLRSKPGRKSIKVRVIHKLWKEGKDFKEKIVFSNLKEQLAFDLEMKLISVFGRINCGTGCLANMTDGGEGTSGLIHTEEVRKRISEANKNPSEEQRLENRKRNLGNKHGLGYRHTDEAKKKMSIARKGRQPTLGHHFSEETKRKMSESGRGNKNSLGYHHSEETRQKMSEAKRGNQYMVGRRLSEETRRKMSEAHKRKPMDQGVMEL